MNPWTMNDPSMSDQAQGFRSPVYYEDQKDEAIRASKEFVKARLPMFLVYFERVLSGKASGDGPWLYGGRLTYADLVLFQVSSPTPSLPLSTVELEG